MWIYWYVIPYLNHKNWIVFFIWGISLSTNMYCSIHQCFSLDLHPLLETIEWISFIWGVRVGTTYYVPLHHCLSLGMQLISVCVCLLSLFLYMYACLSVCMFVCMYVCVCIKCHVWIRYILCPVLLCNWNGFIKRKYWMNKLFCECVCMSFCMYECMYTVHKSYSLGYSLLHPDTNWYLHPEIFTVCIYICMYVLWKFPCE